MTAPASELGWVVHFAPVHCGPASQFRANLIARATIKNLLAMWLNASEIV